MLRQFVSCQRAAQAASRAARGTAGLRWASSGGDDDQHDGLTELQRQSLARMQASNEMRMKTQSALEGRPVAPTGADPWQKAKSAEGEPAGEFEDRSDALAAARARTGATFTDLHSARESYAKVKQRVMERRAAATPLPQAEVDELASLGEATPEDVSQEAHRMVDEEDVDPDEAAAATGVYGAPEEKEWLLELTEENYDVVVEQEEMPVIIDCWAPQCTDSIAVSSSLKVFVEQINARGVKMKIAQLDTNSNYALAMHLDVNALPTLLAVHEGVVLETLGGLGDEEAMAQFVFGFAQAIYGDDALVHLEEHLPLCQLIDARVALKHQDYQESFNLFSKVYAQANAERLKEIASRDADKEKGVIQAERSRAISTAEILASKAAAGQMMTLFFMKRYRAARKAMDVIRDEHDKAYRTLSDVRKAVCTLDIMLLTGWNAAIDVEDLEDEERIDQHNLDIKLKLIGSYFMQGQYQKALSAAFILIRKNRRYKGEAGTIVMMRIMMYMGPYHPVRGEYEKTFQELLQHPLARAVTINKKAAVAMSEPRGTGLLEDEIPYMIDNSQFITQNEAERHPLLR
eukprot:TRINITY_DN11469_c0_g1_i1.p1 TRINITY_DN11469_c0_g1~~TRINITY_DN11469_c0_g1_i1.p1  ORF type:complete len:613 (+),score=158.83 TRINITY_DN11469_c0_g1_i1:117-1841(+)